MLVNSGSYRRSLLIFRKFYGEQESFTGGFPIIEDIKEAFAEFPAISSEEFQAMDEADYLIRLSSFYTYLGLKHAFFNPAQDTPDLQDELINAYGDDTDYCPIDLPLGSRYFISLEPRYRVDGTAKYASVYVTLKDHLGNDVQFAEDLFGTFGLKDVVGEVLSDWIDLEGTTNPYTIPAGLSEALLVPEFQYKGEGVLTSVEVILLPLDENEVIQIYPISRLSITSAQPAFLVNYISTLQRAYQDMISNQIAQEKINSGEGIRILGKKDYIFTFEPDQPKRPVFMYPKAWGKLTEILLVQAQNMNIINDGAFLFDSNEEPFEYTLEVDGENVVYYIYASKAMITYPYRAEYVFKF